MLYWFTFEETSIWIQGPLNNGEHMYLFKFYVFYYKYLRKAQNAWHEADIILVPVFGCDVADLCFINYAIVF